MTRKLMLALGASGLAFSLNSVAMAQDVPAADPAQGEATADDQNKVETANEIVVQAEIGYRNRSESVEPTLIYDTDYF